MTRHRGVVRGGRRIALALVTAGVAAGFGLAGAAAASAGTDPAKPSGPKPPAAVASGQIHADTPPEEKPPAASAPDPGPRPEPLASAKLPGTAAVRAAVAEAVPGLRPETGGPAGQDGKFGYRAPGATVQLGLAAGGRPDAEVAWALAEAAHAGVARSTTTRTAGAGVRLVVTELPHGSQVSAFTPAGLRVVVGVVGDTGKAPSPTTADAVRLAEAIAALG